MSIHNNNNPTRYRVATVT